MHDISTMRKTRSREVKKSRIIEMTRGSTTVKIYRVKNRGTEIFMVTWFVGGKRLRKNYADEKTARREAVGLVDKLSRGQAQAISLTGADRDAYVQAQQELAPLGIPLYSTVRDYATAAKLLNGKPLVSAVQFFLSHGHQDLAEKGVSKLYE